MDANPNRHEIKLRGQLADNLVLDLVSSLRRMAVKNIDVQINIAYPEAPEQGGFFTRPYSVGGPGVYVKVSVPLKHKDALEEFLESF